MTTTSNKTPKHTMPHTPETLKAINGTTIKRIAQTLHKTLLKRKQKVDTVGSIRNIIKTNRVSPESWASTKSAELLELGRQAWIVTITTTKEAQTRSRSRASSGDPTFVRCASSPCKKSRRTFILATASIKYASSATRYRLTKKSANARTVSSTMIQRELKSTARVGLTKSIKLHKIKRTNLRQTKINKIKKQIHLTKKVKNSNYIEKIKLTKQGPCLNIRSNSNQS